MIYRDISFTLLQSFILALLTVLASEGEVVISHVSFQSLFMHPLSYPRPLLSSTTISFLLLDLAFVFLFPLHPNSYQDSLRSSNGK
jgi:hypothetical protein